ncbi:hypothetical protein H4219_001616 [Mycoemilia scoparia]|uniref:Uncharacterized protein n=1 Tax=Mycoemilia scoparia TaxID=417184 RepID=A0A9W7ZZN8_9FUNG|nr:hypothetical protein H4219_001616 [Mycoemilia scoparia]
MKSFSSSTLLALTVLLVLIMSVLGNPEPQPGVGLNAVGGRGRLKREPGVGLNAVGGRDRMRRSPIDGGRHNRLKREPVIEGGRHRI